jgi:hypothetical protein
MDQADDLTLPVLSKGPEQVNDCDPDCDCDCDCPCPCDCC